MLFSVQNIMQFLVRGKANFCNEGYSYINLTTRDLDQKRVVLRVHAEIVVTVEKAM